MLSDSLLVAYIDPSAGGMLVQLLLGGAAGAAVLGKLFWMRIEASLGIGSSAGLKPRLHEDGSLKEAAPADYDRV
jgi:hypothetical protein